MILAAMDAEMPSSIGIRRCRILSPSQPNSGDPTIKRRRQKLKQKDANIFDMLFLT